jgi:hypothetical protein
MKNVIILVLVLLFSSICFSDTIPTMPNTSTLESLAQGLGQILGLTKKQKDCINCEVEKAAQTIHRVCPVPKNEKDACLGVFMNTNCTLGSTGKYIKTLFKTTYTTKSKNIVSMSTLVKHPPADILAACPKYYKLTQDLKENFWIWMMGALAAQENSCHNNVKSGLAGTFQLEAKKSARQNLRPDVCSDNSISDAFGFFADIEDPKPNARCAMAMLITQMAPHCEECTLKSDKVQACVIGSRDIKAKCHTCELCKPPSERKEDLKVLSRGKLFPEGKKTGYFQHLNHPDEKLAGLGNKSLKQVIRSYPYCN